MNTKDLIIKAAIEEIIATNLPTHYLAEKSVDSNTIKPKSKYVWLLDAGHGGINPANGKYQTKGKGFVFRDGLTIQEGVLNRDVLEIVLKLAKELPFELRYRLTAHNWRDTPLKERTITVNRVCLQEGASNCRLISIHHDGVAHIPKANGVGSFYQKKYSYKRSDYKELQDGSINLAKIINKHQVIEMPQCKNRGIKPHNLHMMRESDCISAFSEGAFMTNRKDAEYISSDLGKLSYAKAIIATILEVEIG